MFKKPAQKYSGKICEVEIGTGEKAIKLGGEAVLPFYGFDGNTGNPPKVGMEISDVYPEDWIEPLKELYKDVSNDTVKWAKFVEEKYNPDFICLRLVSADPNGDDTSPEDCAKKVKEVVEAIKTPLVVAGTGNHEKDAKLFEKVAQATEGHNVLLMSAVEDNYKTVAAAGVLAYNNKVVAESAVDINLAKQVNILINQLGIDNEKIVANIGCSAGGYGYEYVISTLDRVKLAALTQNDKTLQVPIITPISFETWKVKESVEPESSTPEWGNQEERGISMEVAAAAGVLTSGSDAVILRHPKSVETVRTFVKELLG
ncbi:acetyl-CoA decarbonylase/synthase complex subunit delta [Clostridium luticellarii]|jgi:acetyl-CoA decarbonylase/synthase complex subunit delta|uniref:acetyl-CoA decarbonylase/synthase complex subunit delta n=1 Tax=Clostridium luticellarii TaxID=1691940 RepID=UPI0023520FAC|nr:acetyl-CoA decarbonylase/synthase complex subunit delta [Clostridium luticellarii]MCI1946187.1 acetyl-CoA decarbonylase/synthase complex subunit delta [Clostridium luticellarii]MCI1969488.1 acetyl-CoA decarbonylase/synthase complex subunit delta [Clostridium luticellarii]